VLTAIQHALAGVNESARVAAVRLLADLSPYRKNDDEEPEAERAARREQMEEKLCHLIAGAVATILDGNFDTGPPPVRVHNCRGKR
jgi:hypothetical protein